MQRKTPLRTAMRELFEKHHLLSAPQILEMLREKGLEVNKTSVYRNLTAFLDEDFICQQSLGTDEFFYELQQDHHDHAQCTRCGKVEEVHCVTPELKDSGFQVRHHHLTFYGLCTTCQTK